MNLRGQDWQKREAGYAMVALLVALSVMSVLLAAAMPVWTTAARREKEAELVFRGEQYARAIALFQRRVANAAPPSIDVLVEQRYLRKAYKDPITGDDFALIRVGQSTTPGQTAEPGRSGAGTGRGAGAAPASGAAGGRVGVTPLPGGGATISAGPSGGAQAGGIIGVVSKSTDESLRLYNGRNHYNEWIFTATERTLAPGVSGQPGVAAPGTIVPAGQPPGGRGRGFGPTAPGRPGASPPAPPPPRR